MVFNPIWKIFVKLDHFPQVCRGENNNQQQKSMKPPVDSLVVYPIPLFTGILCIPLFTRVLCIPSGCVGGCWIPKKTKDSLHVNQTLNRIPILWLARCSKDVCPFGRRTPEEPAEQMGVSKNRGIPKWMVHNGKPYQNGWFGGTPIFGNTQMKMVWSNANQLGRIVDPNQPFMDRQIYIYIYISVPWDPYGNRDPSC